MSYPVRIRTQIRGTLYLYNYSRTLLAWQPVSQTKLAMLTGVKLHGLSQSPSCKIMIKLILSFGKETNRTGLNPESFQPKSTT